MIIESEVLVLVSVLPLPISETQEQTTKTPQPPLDNKGNELDDHGGPSHHSCLVKVGRNGVTKTPFSNENLRFKELPFLLLAPKFIWPEK